MNKTDLKLKRDEIIKYYLEGTSVEELMKIYDTSWSNIYNIVSLTLRKTIKDVTEFEEKRYLHCIKMKNGRVRKLD